MVSYADSPYGPKCGEGRCNRVHRGYDEGPIFVPHELDMLKILRNDWKVFDTTSCSLGRALQRVVNKHVSIRAKLGQVLELAPVETHVSRRAPMHEQYGQDTPPS